MTMKMFQKKITILWLMALISLACSGSRPPQTDAASETAGSRPVLDVDTPKPMDRPAPARDHPKAAELLRILDERLEKGGPFDDVYIESECFDQGEFRALAIYGDGLAIWDGQAEFELGLDAIRKFLQTFKKVDFTKLKEVYGGPQAAATRITCRVVLEIDGVRQQSAQRQRGEQSEALKELATTLFDTCREPASRGVRVANLVEGLDKVARGEISPRGLSIMVHRKPERPSMATKHPGWLFRLTGRVAMTRLYNEGKLGEVLSLEVEDQRLVELAEVLADQDLEGLPANLYAEQYTDVIVRVLRFEKRVQARQFAGMSPKTHGARQEQFDKLYQAFYELHERTVREGIASP